jgi:hypothetical protein
MIGEAIFGLGDWITVAQTMASPTLFRAAVLAIGVVGVLLMVRLSGKYLAGLLPISNQRNSGPKAMRIILVGALTSVVLVLVAAALAPVGIGRGIALAIGAGLAPFVPLAFTARVVAGLEQTGVVDYANNEWLLLVAAILCALIFWLGFGPGISV